MARIAVIGAGVSGLTAAYLLRREHDVVLLEAEDRLGGHAHTHQVGDLSVDSGFIVHNDRTYPLLRRLFRELDVEVTETEMSMSITCDGCSVSYAGGRGPGGILAHPTSLLRPRFTRLLLEVPRFQRLALELLDSDDDEITLGDWLLINRFSDYFRTHYAQPIVACVWSTGDALSLRYPARYLFEFLRHHGLLSFGDSPQWYTVTGGSRRYVDRLAERLADIRTAAPVRAIERGERVRITLDDAELVVDKVVIATHADDALRLLADPSDDERRVLGAFQYSTNETVLHTDESVLPSPQARSSWNYRMRSCTPDASRPEVTYWMNRLQRLPGSTQHLVSLNPSTPVASDAVTARMSYAHPMYTPESVAAQRELANLSTSSMTYAGAYHGWGFHEDGCRSGVRAAEHFGVTW